MPVPDFSPGEVLTAAAMDSIGLWKVAGGALSGTATNFEGCFTSNYENYKIELSKVATTVGFVAIRMLNGSTPLITSSYSYALSNLNTGGGTGLDTNTATTFGALGYVFQNTTNGSFAASWDIFNPFGTGLTMLNGQSTSYYSLGPLFNSITGSVNVNLTNSFDGFQIIQSAGASLTGNVSIYGYRN